MRKRRTPWFCDDTATNPSLASSDLFGKASADASTVGVSESIVGVGNDPDIDLVETVDNVADEVERDTGVAATGDGDGVGAFAIPLRGAVNVDLSALKATLMLSLAATGGDCMRLKKILSKMSATMSNPERGRRAFLLLPRGAMIDGGVGDDDSSVARRC